MTKRVASLLAVCGALAACGGGSSTPTAPPAPTIAVIQLTANPNPIIAAACTTSACRAAGFEFVAATTLTVREVGGVSGNVDFLNITLRSGTTGQELGTIAYGANEVIQLAGTNHINANGSLSIPQVGVVYRLGGGARQGTMTVAVRFGDDRRNTVNASMNVPVV